jgi:hypothetical protein
MAKKQRRSKPTFREKKDDERQSSIAEPQVSQGTIASMLLGQQLGVTNLGRYFRIADRYNGPQLCMRVTNNGFVRGWTAGDLTDQDDNASTHVDAGAAAPLYPVTPMANAFAEEYWPILDSLLQSGTGTRYATSMYEVVRYYAICAEIIDILSTPLILNYLATGFDWSQIAPFSGSIPPSVWGLISLFDCNDVGIQDRWRPLYSRLSTKVMPPLFAASLMDNMMPYVANPYGHVLRVNTNWYASYVIEGTRTIDEMSDYVESLLDKLENELKMCHNTLASFTPFRVGSFPVFFKAYDPTFEEIDFNSGIAAYNGFGDTGDPDNEKVITCGTASENGDSVIFYHKGTAPMVKALMNTPIYDLVSDVDDYFINLSCFGSHKVYFVDDNLSLISYDGSPVLTEEAQRYMGYYPNRFLKADGASTLLEGVGKQGLMPSILAREEIIRASKLYTSLLFGVDGLKRVLSISGGSGVRTIRQSVAEAWIGRKRNFSESER